MTKQVDYEKIKIPTPQGEVTLAELIEKEVEERLAKRRAAPTGLRQEACRLFIQKLYNKGGIAKTKKELQQLAKETAEEISKQIKKEFGFTLNVPIRRGYIAKVKRTIEREGQKVTVWFYTYTPEAIKLFLTPEQIAKPITPEEVEKAVKEA